MRTKILPALLAVGCGAPAAPAAPTTQAPPKAPVAATASAPPAPALPDEPAGLTTPARPASVCEITGTLGDGGIDLAATANGAAFGTVEDGTATLSIGSEMELRHP